MFLEPEELAQAPHIIEDIEKATLRMVVQGLLLYREAAAEIFRAETDLPSDIAEDITREALDALGMSRIGVRLFGKVDYKRARYCFNPDYAVRQALFVDSKAEDAAAKNTITIQLSQTSMIVKQFRGGREISEQGEIPMIVATEQGRLLSTTIFVKYNYQSVNKKHYLISITVAALPNGLLQHRYNPSASDTIWLAGRNAPQRGEKFRVRLSLTRLKARASWRVQEIPMPPEAFQWND